MMHMMYDTCKFVKWESKPMNEYHDENL